MTANNLYPNVPNVNSKLLKFTQSSHLYFIQINYLYDIFLAASTNPTNNGAGLLGLDFNSG